MAEPKKSNPGKEFLEKYGEKLALGVSLVILIVFAILEFGMSSEDPVFDTVRKHIKAISVEEGKSHPGMLPPDTENWQAKAINPWNTVVTQARGADDWAGHLITKAVGTGRKEEVIKKTQAIAPPVSYSGAEVAIDAITVGWAYKDFSTQDKQKMARAKVKTDPAGASYFVLEREVNGSGKWEVLDDKIDPKTLSYVDTKIEPKSKYAYRISAFSTDKAFLERGGPMDEETGATPNPKGLINIVTGSPVQTMGIWKLSFSNPTKPADAAKGMVYVKIEKFEKGIGKVEKSHIHYDGDQIGFWEESSGAEPTSKHRVATKGGKAVEIDFNMGATLISVNPVKLVVDVKRCKPIYNPDGTKKECQTIIEKRNFDTAAITYKDDEGVKKIYVPSPNILDQLCEEHSGRKIMVNLPVDKDKPEEPKVDPKEIARQKKEADAAKLYDAAEAAFTSNNKSAAMSSYQRLLSEFKDTDLVSKDKKASIEERIAALKTMKK